MEIPITLFNDYDSLTYFISRIPFREIDKIENSQEKSLSFKVFDDDCQEMS